MKIGFTGTRNGMTESQKLVVKTTLNIAREYDGEQLIFSHGDCKGADSEAHDLALEAKAEIIIHPPINGANRAWRIGNSEMPRKPYLERNHDIVDAVDYMIACPDGAESLRSGTWATIRYADKVGCTILVIYPNGDLRPNQYISDQVFEKLKTTATKIVEEWGESVGKNV